MDSKYSCKVSDLIKEPIIEETIEEEDRSSPKPKTTNKNVKWEDKKSEYKQKVELAKLDIFSEITEKNNINRILFITIVYILLNTPSVKELVFKNIPILMASETNYSLTGILVSGLILAISSIIFSVYFSS